MGIAFWETFIELSGHSRFWWAVGTWKENPGPYWADGRQGEARLTRWPREECAQATDTQQQDKSHLKAGLLGEPGTGIIDYNWTNENFTLMRTTLRFPWQHFFSLLLHNVCVIIFITWTR
jgi:hypothetical protein